MLWLALASLIASDPSAIAASPQTGAMGPMTSLSAQAPKTPPPAAPAPAMASRTIRLIVVRDCHQTIQRIDDRGRHLSSPTTDGRVRLYRLFALNDAQGCPIEVIARDTVPEADAAIGRQIP